MQKKRNENLYFAGIISTESTCRQWKYIVVQIERKYRTSWIAIQFVNQGKGYLKWTQKNDHLVYQMDKLWIVNE